MSAIEVKHVTKQFNKECALKDVSLTFEYGKIYGLLGRNGAGKSTLLNIITNRIYPTTGEVLLDGVSLMKCDNLNDKVYLMSEVEMFPKTYKVSDVFHYTKQFHSKFDINLAYALCEEFSLDSKKRISKLSTGFTSIYKLITALAMDVPYVFFDEPTIGLDANHRDIFYRSLLERFAILGNTYVISTHLIDEIASIIEDVVILKKGSFLQQSSCEELWKSAYCISGCVEEVNIYIQGKQVLHTEQIGQRKNAYILHSKGQLELNDTLDSSHMDLQKLFVYLTDEHKEGSQ